MTKCGSGFCPIRFSTSYEIRVGETIILLLGSVTLIVRRLIVVVLCRLLVVVLSGSSVGRFLVVIGRIRVACSLIVVIVVVVAWLSVSLGRRLGWLRLISSGYKLVVVVGVIVLVGAVDLFVFFFVLFEIVV